MRKLFIIGNGFDLAHGLKTSYADFFLWFINKMIRLFKGSRETRDSHPLLSIRDTGYLIREFKSLEELKKSLANKGLALDFKYTFIEQLFNKYIDAKWVDVEYEYYQSLLTIYRNYEMHSYIENKKVEGLNTCLDLIKIELSEYLQTIPNITEPNNSILENFKLEMHEVTPENTRILVFNYTDSVMAYANALKISSDNVIYIHGKLQEQDNPIVFGYGDEMDEYYSKLERLNYNEILRNMKSFSYFQTINYQSLSRFIDPEYYKVVIMGHSCGISDRVLLNSIFSSRKCQGIKIYYHKRSEKEKDNDYFEKTQEISRHFISEEKTRMRKLIVPLPQSSPLSE